MVPPPSRRRRRGVRLASRVYVTRRSAGEKLSAGQAANDRPEQHPAEVEADVHQVAGALGDRAEDIGPAGWLDRASGRVRPEALGRGGRRAPHGAGRGRRRLRPRPGSGRGRGRGGGPATAGGARRRGRRLRRPNLRGSGPRLGRLRARPRGRRRLLGAAGGRRALGAAPLGSRARQAREHSAGLGLFGLGHVAIIAQVDGRRHRAGRIRGKIETPGHLVRIDQGRPGMRPV